MRLVTARGYAVVGGIVLLMLTALVWGVGASP